MTIERFVKAHRERPKGAELLVAGDLNINFAASEGNQREEDIVATLATEVLEDMASHFFPQWHRWCQDRRTWCMLQQGREVRSRIDYIMRTDCHLFRNVSVRDPWHISNH